MGIRASRRGGMSAGRTLLDEDGLFREGEEEEDRDCAKEERGQCPTSDHTAHSLMFGVVDVLPVDLLRLWRLLHPHIALLIWRQSEGFPNLIFF